MSRKPKDAQAILYARFSPRPNTAECESIQTQFERLRSWCAAQGWEIAAEYSDEDASGGTMAGRRGLERALTHVCRIRGILCVYSLSRLNRKAKDALTLFEQLRSRKAQLSSIQECIATHTAMGRAFYGWTAVMNELERELIAERTSDAMRRHQARGRRMGRPDRAPYGFRPSEDDSGGLEEEPSEQAVIRTISRLANAGESLRGICRILDEDGIRRRDGGPWTGHHGLVGKILAREC